MGIRSKLASLERDSVWFDVPGERLMHCACAATAVKRILRYTEISTNMH